MDVETYNMLQEQRELLIRVALKVGAIQEEKEEEEEPKPKKKAKEEPEPNFTVED